MYIISKEVIISAAHWLDLSYESKCSEVHGHNWKIKVICCSDEVNSNGMVIDFTKIKTIVNQYDHSTINHTLSNPTAERLARVLCSDIPFCVAVVVEETEGNKSIYIDPECPSCIKVIV